MRSTVMGRAGRAVDEGWLRGGAALDALQGGPVGPPLAVRRWTWALLAGVLGALAGASAVLLRRRLLGQDEPYAQEPTELRAVVDRIPGG